MAEWDSEKVRNAALYDEKFNLNLVLIMEDSESISDYAEYLAQTTESGVRPKFTSLNAGNIAKKVNKFLGRPSQLSLSTPEDFDFPERKLVDISAEAIKHSLLQLRYELESTSNNPPAEPTIDEITGIRSKDMLRANTFSLISSEKTKLLSGAGSKQEVDNLSKASKKKKRKEKTDDELDSSAGGEKGKTAKKEKRKKSKDKVEKSGDDTENEREGENKGKKSNSKKRSRSKSTLKSGSSVIRTTTTSMSSLPKPSPSAQSRNTILRKRGEPKKPNYIIEDDSPRDGPQLYVLLQGFYNPDLLDALYSIGVKIDGVVLLTTNKIEKRNFTVTDIEEIFPGAFQPQNMLPNYLKKIENKINASGEGNSGGVPKFWMNLAKILNKASPDSYIHDIALLNCELPRVFNKEDRTPEQMGADSVEILAVVAKRIFEMAQFQKWHQDYRDAANTSNIDPATSSKPINIYENFMNRIPAECITLPVIMESLLAQVEQDVVENLFGNPEQTGNVHGDDKGNGILHDVLTDYLMTADQEEEEMDHITPITSKKKLKSKSKKLHKKGKEKEKSGKGKPSINNEDDDNNKEEHGKHHKGKPSDKKSDKHLKHHESHSETKVKKSHSRKRVKGKGSSKQWIPPPELTKVNFYANEFEGEEFPHTEPKAFNEEKSRIANFYGYRPLQSSSFQKEPEFDMCPPAPCFKAPIYIKTHDFASIRNCHLREDLAETVAANQVTGDYCSIKNFLWEGIQEFDKGLYMKLHANLTHFMHFLPPGVIDLKDMFFIIHLLMASGVEIHLQKEARAAALRDVEENCVGGGGQSHYCCDKETKKFRSLLDIYEKAKLADGDELDLSHNYLALGTELVNARMILAPGSNNKFNVITSNNSGMEAELPDVDNVEFGSSSDPEAPKRKSLNSDGNDTVGKGSVPEQLEGSVDKIHGAVIAAGNIIANSAELAATLRYGESFEEAVNPETPPNTAIDIQVVDSPTRVQIPFGSGSSTSTSANENQNEEENNFEAQRQERYVQNLKDLAVLQALIACPALLAISESGALDISKWVETYLLCTGLPRASGEGVIVGQLRDWNHAEEMVPVQMIQALSEASQSYLCMERIYCPFYDTILFIFNNPTPYSLYAESSYVTKLNTLAGLQHFLEYTLNDEEVMQFVLDTEKSKGLAAVKTMSVGTLMRLIPEDQWVLIPSIKYTLQQMRGSRHGGFVTETEEEDWTEEEDGQSRGAGDFKSSSRKTMKKGLVGASQVKLAQRRKTRNKTKIDLGEDSKSSLKEVSQTVVGEVVEEITIEPEKSGKKSKKKAESSGSAADSKSASGKKTKDKNKKKGKKGEDDDKTAKKKSAPDLVVPDPETQNQNQANNNRRQGKLKDEPETPLPLLSPQARPADSEPNFKNSLDKREEVIASEIESLTKASEKKFHVYDLGKRHLITTSDDYHLFPLDGTIISYNVSTIEPDFRMMQLRVSKYGHDTFFYPYYIPHEADMTAESFVLIPHFHTVLANGTIFAFQDKRAQEDSKYLKNSSPDPAQSSDELAGKFDPKNEFFDIPIGREFNEKNILFMDDNYDAMMKSKKRALRSVSHTNGDEDENEDFLTPGPQPKEGPTNIPPPNDEDENQDTDDILTADAPPPVPETEDSVQANDPSETGTIANSGSTYRKSKKGKKNKVRSEGSESLSNIEGSKGSKKGKDKKKKSERSKSTSKGKKKPKSAKSSIAEVSKAQISSEKIEVLLEDPKDENGGSSTKSPMDSETMQPPGEWKYPSSDETDSDEKLIHTPSVEHLVFNWDKAEKLIQPLAHNYKITLPSGLYIEVNDMEGPPLTREIKQTYISKGSAYSLVEKSRHYLMNGTVLRFLTNGTIQSLNARGITTNIRELSARVPNEDNTEGPWERFGNASTTKVFKGDIILPTGEFWHIKRGKRTKHDPLFVFTSGTLPNGEIFRRRQDGTIYIHRSDGCCIIHYPDGTRFTTRMILQKDEVPEFEDWTFVGLKYMIEHPNYSPVIINTISGNIHIKLPQGEWTRILADGSIRIQSNDDYKISVDKNKAVLSTAGLKQANPAMPNLTAVKLFHSKDQLISDEKDNQPRASVSQSKYKQEWAGEGDEDFYAPIRSSVLKRQSFAGDATRGLMDQNLRPSSINSTRESLGIPNPQVNTAEENDEFDINNFIQFCDMWTLVKSTDTYDNRLAMDIFGNMIVDKSDKLEDVTLQSAKDIVNSLSSEFQLPQQLLSGIISAASSKEFPSSHELHRFLPLKKSHSDFSSPKPKTRIFVVKRDLSGYEFLKQTVVDRMIRKAKINPEAIVLTDPLPSKSPRKFITIMEPIKDCENPNGMWKSLYREPVFRPQSICNKNLRVARPEDLRWFANILTTAHQKRGNFFLSPKEEYLRKKERQQQEEQGRALEEETKKLKEEREAEECRLRDLAEASRRTEEEKAKSIQDEKSSETASTSKKKSKKGKEKGKKDNESEVKSIAESRKSNKDKKKSVDDDLASETSKNSKNKSKKGSTSSNGSKKKTSKDISVLNDSIDTIALADEEEEDEDILISTADESNPSELKSMDEVDLQSLVSSKHVEQSPLGRDDPGKYPENISDVKGLYGPEPTDLVTISPYHHEEIVPLKKAIIVRTIVEIPGIDDKLQQTLMAASKSYSEIIQEQNKVFESYIIDDPRTAEEKELERQVKRELIEENIQQMHLIEQTAGKLLQLVL